MFNLVHNIDFVVAALIILIVLYLFSRKKYSDISDANRIFYMMLLCAIFTCVVDIMLNLAITYVDIFPSITNMIFRLLYNVGTSFITYLGYRYTRMYQKSKTNKVLKTLDITVLVLLAVYIFISVINMFTGVISYVDENGVYTHGPLYIISTIIPFLIYLLVLTVLVLNREDYTKEQRISIFLYFFIAFIFVILELIFVKVLLVMFGIAISLVVIQMSLVSPEFLELEKSLEEQKKISEDAKQAQELAEQMRMDADNARFAAEASFRDAQVSKVEAMEAQQAAEEAKELAIEANKAKSSFLARMSHEIRTPLNAVIGFNGMIVNETKEDSIRGYAKDAKMAGENLLNLINDILDFSKIESGKLELIEGEYRFDELVKEEYALFNFKAKDKNLNLIFDIDEKIPVGLYGDNLRIKQIITNLLSNAVKYTEKGSITLKISLEGMERNSALIKFIIKDTGMGIKEEDIGKLYDAFERIEEKRNRNIEGTGLGVNICVQLLAMMESKLNVESVYGLGSQFSFSIRQTITDQNPVGVINVASLKATCTDDDKDRDLIEAPDKRILVVDDNSLNIKVFKGLLKNTKINIDSAESGREALELTLSNKYNLIFMDHLMPEMDGIETLNALKEQSDGLNCNTPVVALTANAIKGAYDEYISYGFIDAAFKPVKLKELNEKLWKYLS